MNDLYLEQAVEKIPERMILVNVASRRAKELARGSHPMIAVNPADTPTYLDIALREIAEGKLTYELP